MAELFLSNSPLETSSQTCHNIMKVDNKCLTKFHWHANSNVWSRHSTLSSPTNIIRLFLHTVELMTRSPVRPDSMKSPQEVIKCLLMKSFAELHWSLLWSEVNNCLQGLGLLDNKRGFCLLQKIHVCLPNRGEFHISKWHLWETRVKNSLGHVIQYFHRLPCQQFLFFIYIYIIFSNTVLCS